MFDLEMNNLLKICVEDYLKTNPPIEIKGTFKNLPSFLQNKKINIVDNYSNNSLKIRAEDWAILPYETKTKKYIIGWIEEDNFKENNILIGIAVWNNIPQLSFSNKESDKYPNYLKSELQQLDPMIDIEGAFYD